MLRLQSIAKVRFSDSEFSMQRSVSRIAFFRSQLSLTMLRSEAPMESTIVIGWFLRLECARACSLCASRNGHGAHLSARSGG